MNFDRELGEKKSGLNRAVGMTHVEQDHIEDFFADYKENSRTLYEAVQDSK